MLHGVVLFVLAPLEALVVGQSPLVFPASETSDRQVFHRGWLCETKKRPASVVTFVVVSDLTWMCL